MAEADKIKQFAIIQIMLGTDIVPKIKEADRNRPFCYNSDVVSNRYCSYDGRQRNRPFSHNSDVGRNTPVSCSYDCRIRETDPFVTIQMLVGTDLVPTKAEAGEQTLLIQFRCW